MFKVGDLVRGKNITWLGVIIEVNERDLSFYKSHTHLVQFCSVNRQSWWQDHELEVLCK